MSEKVSLGFVSSSYNNQAPFHPDEKYPESNFSEVSSGRNEPYRLVRTLFYRLGYDASNYNTKDWNPLGHLVKPRQTVVLKPNYVLSFNSVGDDLFAVVTHPSILRIIVDYVFIALKGEGRIIIADVPQMDCDWDQLMAAQKLYTIQEIYRNKYNFDVEVYDLRGFSLIDSQRPAYSSNRKKLTGDPNGSVVVNLGTRSEFYGLPSENYYGADYNREETIKHHHGDIQEYCISKTILSADTFISVPKLKVHKKVGVTLNLKGLVGINTNKNYLVHYRLGSPTEGGDQVPNGLPSEEKFLIKAQRYLFDKALAKQNKLGDLVYQSSKMLARYLVKPFVNVSEKTMIQDSGNWYGNDSAWRMTFDLAKILFFADANGELQNVPQRKIFCLIDGVIGGENNGPLSPNAKPAGCLIAGENPVAVDMVGARVMGFDVLKIKQLSHVFSSDCFDFGIKHLDDILVLADDQEIVNMFHTNLPFLGFRPHPGWVGHIEV